MTYRPLAAALCALSGALAAQSPGTYLGSFVVQTPTTSSPYGLGLGTNGNLLVGCSGTPDEVHVIDTTGASLSGFIAAQTAFPFGVATDGTSVYVVNGNPQQIDVYTPQGTHVRSMPIAAQTLLPRGLAYVSTRQRLVVADGTGGRPQALEFDLQGNLVGTHALHGDRLDGLCWDVSNDTYWVYDTNTDTMRHYDAAFTQIGSFLGTRALSLGACRGLARSGDFLYALTSTRQVAMFDATGSAGLAIPYGLGCPTPAAIYELFAASTMDLSGLSYAFTPNANGGYDVRVCTSSCFDPNLGTNLNLTDDSMAVNQPLGFPFPVPGGSTTVDIDVSSNGFVYLQTGTGANHGCCVGDPTTFLNGPPRIATHWQDLDPSSAAAGGGVFMNTIAGRAVVTWSQVPEFGQNANPLTVQLQLLASGQFIISWQNVANATHIALVGFCAGNGLPDPGPVDLTSSVPFSTAGAGIPVTLSAPNRPVLGGSITLDTGNLPTGAVAGGTIVGTQRTALALGRFGAAGCTLYSSGEITTIPISLSNPTITLTVPATPALANVSLYLQSAILVPAVNNLSAVMSNGLELAFGPY